MELPRRFGKTLFLSMSFLMAGRLGIKIGQGFYRYPKPAFMEPGFLEGRIAPEVSAEINLKAS